MTLQFIQLPINSSSGFSVGTDIGPSNLEDKLDWDCLVEQHFELGISSLPP
ncbi:hypothetical protein PISMIDRAFT_18970 [Pisolithus microcarpus 441]|uniref:Uncharacterized protein n=1 Tax=Pisolithus microcarpus 441 TaxID=765257 RepID=A0A0C9YP40_9AGAM|nr:hypothetical protein PISMIDRAFT_18970 [Pisolithus microcarpus 441]